MAYLSWITDKNLSDCVRDVLIKGLAGIDKAEKDFYRNGVDPFSATFDAACNNMTSFDEWIITERRRQSQKTLQNALGHFHQYILSHVDGWHIPEENFIDLVCEDKSMVVELKNKHNTVKKSDLKSVYDELQEAVMHKTSRYRGFTAYYVTIIPSTHEKFNRPFTPSDNATKTLKPENSLIREIDGFSFYGIATGVETALSDLFEVLPFVIKQVLSEERFKEYPQDQLDKLMADPLRHQLFAEAFG
jgi:Eco47II restriction endonuclease